MKLLNGQCEKDFNYYLSYFDICENHDIIHWKHSNEEILENLPVSMQFGVIQDFADSKGINITLYQLDYQDWYGYNIVKFGKPVITGGVWRRDKAREQAIKHFNKLYNAKY